MGSPSKSRGVREIRITPIEKDLFVDSKSVYLKSNKILGSYDSCEEYLDVHFRLLSEDFLIPLREEVKSAKKEDGTLKHYMYRDVKIQSKKGEGEELLVPIVRNDLSDVNWKDSKLFLNGSLLLLTTDNFHSVRFALITKRGKRPEQEKVSPSSIGMKVKFLNDSLTLHEMKNRYEMIESPAYFEVYKLSLEYLKKVDLNIFPMKKYIVDAVTTSQTPNYLVSVIEELQFSAVRSQENKNCKPLKAPLLDLKRWPTAVELNMDESQFEAFQKAITQELTIIQGPPGTGKTFIGIQIVKLLLSNPSIFDSPIFIVSYTNHALDQALELIHNYILNELCDGDKKTAQHKILRLGGGSKSDTVKTLTLHHKMKHFLKKRVLEIELQTLHSVLERVRELNFEDFLLGQGIIDFFRLPFDIRKSLATGEKSSKFFSRWEEGIEEIREDPLKWFGIQIESESHNNLETETDVFIYKFPKHFVEGCTPDPKLTAIIDRVMSNQKLDFENVSKLEQRWGVYFSLVKCVMDIVEQINQNYLITSWDYAEVEHYLPEIETISAARVIGMTTTGAVKYKDTVLETKPKIVIVEEAAHVLEIFVVASLTKYCEQLILIGDHKQLRPLTGDYNLAIDYNFDVSLMERLVENGRAQGNQNWVQLKVQHRMRPEIARLICPAIYEELYNHPDVLKYPNVRGVSKNLFFLDHQNHESQGDNSKSYFNKYEAKSLAWLVNYFVSQQNYQQSQITIIATYLDQKFLIQRELKSQGIFKEVEVRTVDCYQGEENDIILLSLVRNNNRNDVGFLSTDNRVCVALSRARQGLFITGNMWSLKSKSETWAKIAFALQEMKSIGHDWPLQDSEVVEVEVVVDESNLDVPSEESNFEEELELDALPSLINDPEPILVEEIPSTSEEDVEKEPELLTMHLLDCGHSHELGQGIECLVSVEKMLPCGHEKIVPCCVDATESSCGETKKMLLSCGHTQDVPCYENASEFKCVEKSTKKLSCGHKKEALCYEFQSGIECQEEYDMILLCGHQKKVICIGSGLTPCDVCVVRTLSCGHRMEVPVERDLSKVKCSVMVVPDLSCGHDSLEMKYPCHSFNQLQGSLCRLCRVDTGRNFHTPDESQRMISATSNVRQR